MNARNPLFVVPGDPDQPTGGYRYDARIVTELRALGWTVDVVGLPGRFPDADEEGRTALDRVLADRPDDALVVADGLALGGLPDVAERHAGRLRLVALVHHPLADESGLPDEAVARFRVLESRTLDVCRRVVTTSRFTASRLTAVMGVPRSRIRVVEPGVDRAAPVTDPRHAREERSQRLLCVGSLVPRKGQDELIDALLPLADLDWTLDLVGDPGRDPAFARALGEKIESSGLGGRVRLAGVRAPGELDDDYRHADVLVVPSRYEGYGMVLTEALARGLPLIATDGGALADTVPADCALQVRAGDRAALTGALRRWLTDPGLRARLVETALEERDVLTDWTTAGRRFARALDITEVPA